VRTIEELLGRKSNVSGLENREYDRMGSVMLTSWHPLFSKVGIDVAGKWRSFGGRNSLADWSHGVCWAKQHGTMSCSLCVSSSYAVFIALQFVPQETASVAQKELKQFYCQVRNVIFFCSHCNEVLLRHVAFAVNLHNWQLPLLYCILIGFLVPTCDV
jgi:hypothetical protein